MSHTSNKGFVDWGEVLDDQVVATAILERLLHHAATLSVKGERFRLMEKAKHGLVIEPANQVIGVVAWLPSTTALATHCLVCLFGIRKLQILGAWV